jgi:hypothetical protein
MTKYLCSVPVSKEFYSLLKNSIPYLRTLFPLYNMKLLRKTGYSTVTDFAKLRG